VLVSLLALLSSTEGVLLAQSGAAQTSGAGMPLSKGSVELGGIAGTTAGVSWLRAHADRRLTLGAVDIGRIVTTQHAPGPLAGHFEFLLEFSPFLVIAQPGRTWGFTASPLHMRWNFAGRSNVRPFAEASGGIVYSGVPVPARATTQLNFIDQAGFGLRFGASPRRAWLAGYRFQHISNAGRMKPNPGANFNFFYGGVTFLR